MRRTNPRQFVATWVGLAAFALCGCGHGVHNAWEALAVGESVAACGTPASCKLTVHEAPGWPTRGAAKVAVLQLKPQLPWQVHHHDGRGLSASAWRQNLGAAVVFNAGFYGPHGEHVGWLKSASDWQQPQRSADWYGLILSGPISLTEAATRLLDLQRDLLGEAQGDSDVAGKAGVGTNASVDACVAGYAHVMQSMVLLDDTHALRCRDSLAAASRTVVADDADGTLYVVVTQGAWRLRRLADWLLLQLPGLQRAINLDGGHEAQLAVHGPFGTLEFLGEHGSHGAANFGRTRRLPYVWSVAEEMP